MSSQPMNLPAVSNQGTGWSITGQSEVTGADAQGQYVRGVQVSFRTDSGLVGSVFVPHTNFGVEAVRRAVSERVARMTAVQNLTG